MAQEVVLIVEVPLIAGGLSQIELVLVLRLGLGLRLWLRLRLLLVPELVLYMRVFCTRTACAQAWLQTFLLGLRGAGREKRWSQFRQIRKVCTSITSSWLRYYYTYGTEGGSRAKSRNNSSAEMPPLRDPRQLSVGQTNRWRTQYYHFCDQ